MTSAWMDCMLAKRSHLTNSSARSTPCTWSKLDMYFPNGVLLLQILYRGVPRSLTCNNNKIHKKEVQTQKVWGTTPEASKVDGMCLHDKKSPTRNKWDVLFVFCFFAMEPKCSTCIQLLNTTNHSMIRTINFLLPEYLFLILCGLLLGGEEGEWREAYYHENYQGRKKIRNIW